MPSLYLHPADPLWQPATHDSVIDSLRVTGLIGRSSAQADTDEFMAGDRFMEQVMFLGCSPQLPGSPQTNDGQHSCYIRLHCYAEIRFLIAAQRPAVRCAACRTPARLSVSDSFDAVYQCRQCCKESLLTDLDWRKGAGFGHIFIEISGVYPHEAVPSDALLNALAGLSGCHWKYFYMQGQQGF